MRMRIIATGSGNHAVQVVTKVGYDLVIHKHLGTYVNDLEKKRLLKSAEDFIQESTHQNSLFSDVPSTWTLGEIKIINSQPLYLYNLLSQAYDKLGFGGDPLIRDLVISRLYQPTSKRETSEILENIF